MLTFEESDLLLKTALSKFYIFNQTVYLEIRSVQLLSHVQLFVTLWTVAHQAPPSTGILQARILEWVAMSSSRGSSQPRDQTQVSCIAGDSLPSEPYGSFSSLSHERLFVTPRTAAC